MAWRDFFDGMDFLILPIFATCAFDHDHSGTDVLPFWRETGRTLEVDGEAGAYQRHVFWSALTGTCFLPSTAFPTGLGEDSKMPIGPCSLEHPPPLPLPHTHSLTHSLTHLSAGLQIVGPERSDFSCIEFARLLETELGFAFEAPGNKFGE